MPGTELGLVLSEARILIYGNNYLNSKETRHTLKKKKKVLPVSTWRKFIFLLWNFSKVEESYSLLHWEKTNSLFP